MAISKEKLKGIDELFQQSNSTSIKYNGPPKDQEATDLQNEFQDLSVNEMITQKKWINQKDAEITSSTGNNTESQKHHEFKEKESHQACQLAEKEEDKELVKWAENLDIWQSKVVIKNLFAKWEKHNPKMAEITIYFQSRNVQIISCNQYYNTGEILGEGGFGIVFKGKWMKTIDVAIKEMNVSMNDFKNADKEIIAMATCRHPRIITLYGVSLFEMHNKMTYSLLLELMEMDLETYIQKQSIKKSLNEKILILKQILEGLSYLHSQDVIHGDVKPKNVLLDSNMNVKLTDLGLSKMLGTLNKAESSTLAFTARYASKSVVAEGKFSFQSDMWAFGLLMYELIKETKPFQKLNQIQVLLDLQLQKTPFENKWRENVPTELADLITACVNYNEVQIPTAQYCLEQLEGLNYQE